jgi:hypothetical protein
MPFEVCNFYDLDALIAEEERIKVKFEHAVSWCGLLFYPEASSSNSTFTEIAPGTTVKVPIWQIRMLKESKSTSLLISLTPSSVPGTLWSQDLVCELQADAISVNFFGKSPNFSLLVAWLSRLAGAKEKVLFEELQRALHRRSIYIFYQALFTAANEVAFVQKLDLKERALLKQLSLGR